MTEPSTGAIVSILQALPEGSLAAGLVALLFVLLATDRMVTGPQHRRALADKDKTIDTLSETVKIKDEQLEKALIVGETQVKILESIEDLAKEKNR